MTVKTEQQIINETYHNIFPFLHQDINSSDVEIIKSYLYILLYKAQKIQIDQDYSNFKKKNTCEAK